MLSILCVGCFTFLGLTVASASGYTGCIGSRERITPMNEEKGIAAVERAAIPGIDGARPASTWLKTFLVSVNLEGADS